MFSLGLAGKMRIRGQIPARLHTLYGYFTVFERVKTHTYGGVRLMLIFLKPRGPSIKDVGQKRGVRGHNKLYIVLLKGQINRKQFGRNEFVCRKKQKSNQNKFVSSFFGRIFGASICIRF